MFSTKGGTVFWKRTGLWDSILSSSRRGMLFYVFLLMFPRIYREFESMDGHKIAIVVLFNACSLLLFLFYCCVGFRSWERKLYDFCLSILLTLPVRATGQREACFVHIEINKYIGLKIVHFRTVVMRLYCINNCFTLKYVPVSFFFAFCFE